MGNWKFTVFHEVFLSSISSDNQCEKLTKFFHDCCQNLESAKNLPFFNLQKIRKYVNSL